MKKLKEIKNIPMPVQAHLLEMKKAAARFSNEGKGSSTLFRVMYDSHLNFSRMADHKAHLMIGINVFVLSLVIAKKKMGMLAYRHELLIPNILLVATSLACVVLALLAVRPRVGMWRKNKPVEDEQINPMFFGSYSHLSPDDFHGTMMNIMQKPKEIRAVMVRDLHGLGNSLARKYRLLSWCYQVFYIGLPAVVLSYLVAEGLVLLH